jgi:hypothetical protein
MVPLSQRPLGLALVTLHQPVEHVHCPAPNRVGGGRIGIDGQDEADQFFATREAGIV